MRAVTTAVTATLALMTALAPAGAQALSGSGKAGETSSDASAAAAPGRPADGGPNPYLTLLAGGRPDYAAWRTRLAADAAERADSARLAPARARVAGAAASPTAYAEREPAGTVGANDSLADAERITDLGTAAGQRARVDIDGELSDPPAPVIRALAPVAEDNGSIPLAGDTGIDGPGGITTTGTLGDGPHGSQGDRSNDFDVYRLHAFAGDDLVVDTSATTAATDTVVAVYDASGRLLGQDDDGGTTPGHSRLDLAVPATGDYYVVVAAYALDGSLPVDPFDSGSGRGGAGTGPYAVAISDRKADRDFYGVRLRPGDVLAGTASGGVNDLEVSGPDGRLRVGAAYMELSGLYPPSSPLPGGGTTTFAYVAETAGWYRVQVDGALGRYGVDLETYRPGTETAPRRLQTVFLDFDPGRVNTSVFDDDGRVSELSPFRDFITRWGLAPGREGELIRRITAVVRENIASDQAAYGRNPAFRVQVLNSRYSPDRWGQPGVSRVLVGGTAAQTGLNQTVGISQYVDPGNFDTEDEALVLLDTLSDPDTEDAASINAYLTGESDRIAFVAQVVGNVISHELGHLVGNFHTDPADGVLDLADASVSLEGGGIFDELYGVGPDGVGGTADDVDVDFATDRYAPDEGFTGTQNALNVTDWAYVYAR